MVYLLNRRGFRRYLRTRGDAVIDELRLDESWAYVQPGQVVGLLEKANIFGCVMQVVVTRTPGGELLALASGLRIDEPQECVPLEMNGEKHVKCAKSRGFDLEVRAMSKPERLFSVVTLGLAK